MEVRDWEIKSSLRKKHELRMCLGSIRTIIKPSYTVFAVNRKQR